METIQLLIGPDKGADTLQLCCRALLLFVFGIVCIRIAGRRAFAQYTPLDIIVALIVGSNLSRVMTGEVPVVPALSATLLLVFVHRLLALASLRWPRLSWLVRAHPIELIRDGKVDDAALRRANLTDADLHEALRMEQAEQPKDVHLATLESGGKVSVVHRR
jgi:uncharacterized membrane protein YcaP (DUF421 family)